MTSLPRELPGRLMGNPTIHGAYTQLLLFEVAALMLQRAAQSEDEKTGVKHILTYARIALATEQAPASPLR